MGKARWKIILRQKWVWEILTLLGLTNLQVPGQKKDLDRKIILPHINSIFLTQPALIKGKIYFISALKCNTVTMSVNADAAIKFARRYISWNQLLKSWIRSLIPETENKQLSQPPGKTNNLIVLLTLPINSYGKNVGQTVFSILDWKPIKEKKNSEFKIMSGIHSSPAPPSSLDKKY